ncbi:ferric-chelate reductase (NADH)2 [Zea mays]|uniref:NADH-cytochrome b5 reductase n=1 Tax=Zea mays TaxID=4577 RepID=A0A1D6M6Z3_MAIZE|nr:ferric-chelate reductase (NADH)2 [Zea mays]
MEFLQGQRLETTLAVAAAVVAVAAGSAYLFLRSRKPRGCLDPENFKEFKLVEKRQLSHNVAKFKFALPTPTSVLGLPIGQHISCRGQDASGEEVIKPYTPTTLDSDVGSFELVIKVIVLCIFGHRCNYLCTVVIHHMFSFLLVVKMYPQGRMSHHFREMKVGDYMSVKGPKGRFKYLPGQVRALGMVAGGSGITPMFQVTRAILENPKDNTKVHLIYANVTYEDILLKEELDGMAKNYPDRFKIYYVLNQPPEVWDGGVGFVSKEMIQTHCPAPAADIQVLRCGPPPMNKAMAAHLDDLGYTKEMQFQF